ncbi:MAG: hypothetical protein Q8Q09_28590 [Deltaproteobacteria bacterium]|nr:hypothetical protein [Deltaproteobacteria bacterium]
MSIEPPRTLGPGRRASQLGPVLLKHRIRCIFASGTLLFVLPQCSGAAGNRSAMPLTTPRNTAPSAQDPGAQPWSLRRVDELPEDPEALIALEDAPASAPMWLLGGLRGEYAPGEPLQVRLGRGPAVLAPIVAAAPTDDGSWLFATRDGALWHAGSFLGELQRVSGEAGRTVRGFTTRSWHVLALTARDGSLYLGRREGLVRAPDVLDGPVISAAFANEQLGVALVRPGTAFATNDRGAHWHALPVAPHAALSVRATATEIVVRTTHGLATVGADLQWQPRVLNAAPVAHTPMSTEAREITNKTLFSAALREPSMGPARALSYGAVWRTDGPIAWIEDDTLVTWSLQDGLQIDPVPCSGATVHAFGAAWLAQCSEHEHSRLLVGGRRAWSTLAAQLPDEITVVAPDASAVVVERPCHQGPSHGLCVISPDGTRETLSLAARARVLSIRARRVLIDRGDVGQREHDYAVISLAESDRTPRPLPDTVRWQEAFLTDDGTAWGPALATETTAEGRLSRTRVIARVSRTHELTLAPLPSRNAHVAWISPSRWIAWQNAPFVLWSSRDQGAHWTLDSRAVSEPTHDVVALEDQDLARPAAPRIQHTRGPRERCLGPYCVLPDHRVYAQQSALPTSQPSLAALNPSEPSGALPRRPTRQSASAFRLYFCSPSDGSPASPSPAHAPSLRFGAGALLDGAPRHSPDEADDALRGLRVRDGSTRVFRARTGSPLPPLGQQRPARDGLVELLPRLVTAHYAVVERCLLEARCELLFFTRNGSVRSLGFVDTWLSGPDWQGRVHAVQTLGTDGNGPADFVVWLTRASTRPGHDTPSEDHDGADAILHYDAQANLRAFRAFAWGPSPLELRALSLSAGTLGMTIATREDPNGLQFYSISGDPMRSLARRFADRPPACQAPRTQRSDWLLSSTPGYGATVYFGGRVAPIERGLRVRWELEDDGWCLARAHIESSDLTDDSLQIALQGALTLRAHAGALEASRVHERGTQAWRCSEQQDQTNP